MFDCYCKRWDLVLFHIGNLGGASRNYYIAKLLYCLFLFFFHGKIIQYYIDSLLLLCLQRAMVQKSTSVALPFVIQLVRISLKLIEYLQIHLLTNVFVLFHAFLVFMSFEMHWKSCLHFVFLLWEVGQ